MGSLGRTPLPPLTVYLPHVSTFLPPHEIWATTSLLTSAAAGSAIFASAVATYLIKYAAFCASCATSWVPAPSLPV